MSHPNNPPNTRIQKDEQSPRRTLRALLDFTFLRYCVVGALASGVFYCVANLSALLLKQVDSSDNAQNVSKLAQDSNAFTQNAQNLETPQAANRQLQNASKLAQDSRICDEKCGLQGKSQGSYLDGNDRRDFSPLPHLSRKAESTKETQYSQTATLLGSLASFIFGYFAQMRLAFRANPNHSTMLPRYLALLAIITIYAQAIAYLGAFFTLSYYLVSAFIALSVPLFSYPLQKLWVFASSGGGGATHSVDFAYFLAYDTSVLDSTSTLDFALSFLYFLYRFLFYSLFHTRESSLESTFSYNAPTPSLRALPSKAWQSIQHHAKSLESIFQNAATLSKPQAAGFLMKNWGFQGSGKGVTLAVMTADTAAESTIFRKKPTPNLI